MSSNHQHLCEDWGWYVDIENMTHQNHYKQNIMQIINKNNIHQCNILRIIKENEEYEEDAYDYCNANSTNFNDDCLEYTFKKNDNVTMHNILHIGSTIMFSVIIITYVSLSVL